MDRTTDVDMWDDPYNDTSPNNDGQNTELTNMKLGTNEPINHKKVKSTSMDKHTKKIGNDFRDEFSNDDDKLAYIHPCIWCWIIWIILSYVGLFILNNEGIMVTGAGMGNAGVHYASFGWSDYEMYVLKSTSKIDGSPLILLKNDFLFIYTKRILNDINLLFLVTFSIAISFVCIIILILCIRCQSKTNYSLSIGNMLFIPQRPVVMILFDSISILTWAVTFMFIVLTFYSLMEILVYAGLFCIASGEGCYVFPSPHAGIIVLFILDLIWGCFIMQKVVKLDYKLESRSMFAYFPKLGTAAVDDSSPIFLGELTSAISASRKLIVLYIWSWCLQYSGLLSIWFVADNGTDGSSLMFWGMTHGISNEDNYTSSNASNWVNIGNLFNILYPVMILISIIILIYSSVTIHRYIYSKSMRWFCIIISTIQSLCYIALIALYYITFSQYWNNEGRTYVSRSPIIETPLNINNNPPITCGEVVIDSVINFSINNTALTTNNNQVSIQLQTNTINFDDRCRGPYWTPDWSVFLMIVILFYQFRMIWKLLRFPRPKPPGA